MGLIDTDRLTELTKVENEPYHFKPDPKIIYEPGFKAAEYSPLASNPYSGCTHACEYCFMRMRMKPAKRQRWDTDPSPKPDYVNKLKYKVRKMAGDEREILFSFSADVYQPIETELKLMREAIKVMIDNDMRFTVLTKGGLNAARDFDLLQNYDKCSFGSTIVFLDEKMKDVWEPGAPTIKDRISALQKAKEAGIKTWVSLEPVIDAKQAIRVIKKLHPIVDHWKIGKVNYHPVEKDTDWLAFKKDVVETLESVGADYKLKFSLMNL
ncbi:MAG: radical SAM protein [Deltaproteobacteria bacterium]|nr:radical SAM protein [Deltaproteobacteria bacterium]